MPLPEITVAVASENDEFDGEIYRVLLQLVLERPVRRWQTQMRFDGHRAIYKLAAPFLDRAQQHGVRHAILAVDNDGGQRRRPEHDEARCPALGVSTIAIDDEDACRMCWLRSALPPDWRDAGGLTCLAVPVQTIETWLLHIRGDALEPSPEQCYHRPTLKKRFFGRPLPSAAERLRLALEQLQRTDALSLLRERPSFRLMESHLASWQ